MAVGLALFIDILTHKNCIQNFGCKNYVYGAEYNA